MPTTIEDISSIPLPGSTQEPAPQSSEEAEPKPEVESEPVVESEPRQPMHSAYSAWEEAREPEP